MRNTFKNLKNDLRDLEGDQSDIGMNRSSPEPSNSNRANYILLVAFLAAFLFYGGSRLTGWVSSVNDFTSGVVDGFSGYDAELLTDMGVWMEELGYGVLTDQELSDLRDEGVTATETQRLHDIGLTSITLEQLVELQRADISASEIEQFRDVGYKDATLEQLVEVGRAQASPTYARMMKELGYELTMEDLAETRRNGVTANFTSRMMDMGYSIDELTKENLIRLRSVNVTESLVERRIEALGYKPTIDELVRYRISNQ